MNRPLTPASALALALSSLAFGGAAQACNPVQAQQSPVARLMLPQPPISIRSPDNATASQAVVGTWMVNYVVNGNTVNQALVQWHDDGTEWQSVNQPADGGNVCLGSWKPIDSKHVYRYHMGWTFADEALSGYIVEDETDRVSAKGTYKGNFNTKVYDVNGNLLNEITGTTAGTKISP